MRFPEFTGEWKITSFSSNLEKLENGATYNANDTIGVPMSRIETISSGRIDYSKVGYCSTPDKIMRYKMQYGDILFSHINSIKHIGKTAYYMEELPLYHGMNLLLLRCNHNIDSKFFFYLINNIRFLHHCQILAKQAVNQASISISDLKGLTISIPPKDEQLKIQKLLSLIDDRIDTQNKIIEKYMSLIKGIMAELQKQGVDRGTWKKVFLSDVLTEKNERNTNLYRVFSVSVSQGVVNQVDYLGRSFAAKDTSKYNVVHYGDLVYTKSPTGSFPYGIVKQSLSHENAAVSPLYGVYEPNSFAVGTYLHEYFMSEINTHNYLHPLIQKGAKNTINITNQRFLENRVILPINANELLLISKLLRSLNNKVKYQQSILQTYQKQKQYLLRQMFI